MDDRLKKALHYVIYIAQAEGLSLGATLLLKIIVFADVFSFYERTKVITGAKIVKGEHGPVPDGHQDALRSLEAEGKIRITPPVKKFGKTGYASLTLPDLTGFDPEDLGFLRGVTKEFCGRYTATLLRQVSHNHSWDIAEMGEEIPLASYLCYASDFSQPDTNEAVATEEELAQIAAELKAEGLDGEIPLEA